MISAPSVPHEVPPLQHLERFHLAALRAIAAWFSILHQAEWERLGRPRRTPEPCVGVTLAEDMLLHGPALWENVRAVFAGYYEDGLGAEEHYLAEHRFWAVWRLRDRLNEPNLRPWFWPNQPYWPAEALVAAAAEARLTISYASMDEPLDECSEFDLEDLLARTTALHIQGIEKERALWEAGEVKPSNWVPPSRESLSALPSERTTNEA